MLDAVNGAVWLRLGERDSVKCSVPVPVGLAVPDAVWLPVKVAVPFQERVAQTAEPLHLKRQTTSPSGIERQTALTFWPWKPCISQQKGVKYVLLPLTLAPTSMQSTSTAQSALGTYTAMNSIGL